jgi:hypothetical protein
MKVEKMFYHVEKLEKQLVEKERALAKERMERKKIQEEREKLIEYMKEQGIDPPKDLLK